MVVTCCDATKMPRAMAAHRNGVSGGALTASRLPLTMGKSSVRRSGALRARSSKRWRRSTSGQASGGTPLAAAPPTSAGTVGADHGEAESGPGTLVTGAKG